MSAAPDHIDDLIASYLAGEATPDEIQFIDQWRSENEGNRKYFEHLKLIFERAATSLAIDYFDTDEAWQKLRQKLPSQNDALRIKSYRSTRFGFLKAAAVIIALITAGIFSYQAFRNNVTTSVYLASDLTTTSDTLPDGSDVFLNRQTKIEYSFDKRNNTHTARITGEAYFNINHDADNAFIVEANGTFIKDIGTSFNVKAYPDSPTIEVVVEEGEVMFYTKNNPGVSVKANGKGMYNKDTGEFTVGAPEANVTAYKTKFFNFRDSSLETVIRALNSVYNTTIRIDDRVKNCRLTVSFNEENIEEIVQVIAETLALKISRDGHTVVLSGSGCGEAPGQ